MYNGIKYLLDRVLAFLGIVILFGAPGYWWYTCMDLLSSGCYSGSWMKKSFPR